MLSLKPVRIVDGIYDFIGNSDDDYVENYEKIARTYYEDNDIDIATEAISNCVEIIIKNKPFNDEYTIIDVGSEFGYVAKNLMDWNPIVLDISLETLKLIPNNLFRIRANAECMPLESEWFDIVICTNLFEHVLNAEKLSYELNRILKPGGTLLFACPWKQDLSVYESEEYKKRFKQYKYKHLRSVDWDMINKHFGNFHIVASTNITVAMRSMLLTPYYVKFIQFYKGWE